MFYRIRLALKEEKEIKEQGRQEAYQEMSDRLANHITIVGSSHVPYLKYPQRR